MPSFIQQSVRQGIITDPGTAAREVPAILGHYITGNTKLNRVYQAAERHCLQPDAFTLEALRQAVKEAKA